MKPPTSAHIAGQGGETEARAIAPRAPIALVPGSLAERICAAAERTAAALDRPIPAARIASAIADAGERWRDRHFAPRAETVAEIAAAWGYTEALLDESIDAVLAPFSREALDALARGASSAARGELGALVMAGNVPGAGLHEVAIALVAGCGLIIKTATAEPVFFAKFAHSIALADAEVGARLAVFNWSRDDAAANAALRGACAWLVAYGDDGTLAELNANAGAGPNAKTIGGAALGFGHRMSGAIVSAEFAAGPIADKVAGAIARDVSLGEQLGCLSPHHIFVETGRAAGGHDGSRDFAGILAAALERFAVKFPPPRRYALEDAAAIRRMRESARWRAIGGEAVELVEGGLAGQSFGWTVIHDAGGKFTPSPGFRTVTVSPFTGLDDLKLRLAPAAGRLEAIALAAPPERTAEFARLIDACGVTWCCAPGAMQSPPIGWPHGGGGFLRLMGGGR
ncbi:MAG: hypothetical protein IVW56_10820 [Candidatus Binataceae bacterium]|nr:hypothetical protein [Candidatus Binataceae bacterium]